MIAAVDGAQQQMCAAVRPGFDYKQLHVDAHLSLMGVLKDFGVIKVSPQTAVETGVSAAFFPHGIGHLIGLQVHDVAGFAASDEGGRIERPAGHPYLRLTRVLEPGMVVTIEPGLYFREDDLLIPPEYRGIGIRIEDDVLMTEDGPEWISAGIPKQIDDVEAWMADMAAEGAKA